jgi:TolB protein
MPSSPKRSSVALAALAASLLGLVLLVPAVQAAYPGTAGKILFDREDPNTGDIEMFTINADGSGLLQLTSNGNGNFEGDGSYNGDGNLIAFDGPGPPPAGNDNIFVLNTATGQAVNVTNDQLAHTEPAFTADGRKILFEQFSAPSSDLFSMNADGTGRVNLTNSPGRNEFCASVSPDGRTVYFTGTSGGDGDIFSMQSDGSDVRQLTFNSFDEDCVDVSPSGRQLAFHRDTGTGQADIIVMNPDGSGQVDITNNASNEQYPVYSPNGRRIAFSRDTDNDGNVDEIFVTDPKGSVPLNVTNSGPADFDLVQDWQPIPIKCGGRRSTIVGSKAREKLRGTPLNDVIYAGGGRDTVNGFGGRDIICGAGGKDKLFGGGGKDRLLGGGNRDACFGGTGRDTDGSCERGKIKPRHKK